MSFAQFRPEKDHIMQIRVFERVLERLNDIEKQKLSFVNIKYFQIFRTITFKLVNCRIS